MRRDIYAETDWGNRADRSENRDVRYNEYFPVSCLRIGSRFVEADGRAYTVKSILSRNGGITTAEMYGMIIDKVTKEETFGVIIRKMPSKSFVSGTM